jgi:hypothetical protein
MKFSILLIFFYGLFPAMVQSQQMIEFNKEYKNTRLTKTSSLVYKLSFAKEGICQFSILQQGIAVYYTLSSAGNKNLFESNYPDDVEGYDKSAGASLIVFIHFKPYI